MGSWFIECKNLNRVVNQLKNLENIQAEQILNEVQDDAQKIVRQGIAEAGFSKSAKYVDVEKTGGGKYAGLDIGLHGKSGSFENWKEAYFHHFGYNQFAWGRPTGKKTVIHVGYFNNVKAMTASQVKPVLEQRIKQYMNNKMK